MVYNIACFHIAIVLIAIILLAQAPRALVIMLWDDPLEHLLFTPIVDGLLISNKTLGKKPLVEPKNSRMGTLKKFSWKWCQKSWSSIYSTEVFYKKTFEQMMMLMKDKGDGDF
jgi:hypothetical protein